MAKSAAKESTRVEEISTDRTQEKPGGSGINGGGGAGKILQRKDQRA